MSALVVLSERLPTKILKVPTLLNPGIFLLNQKICRIRKNLWIWFNTRTRFKTAQLHKIFANVSTGYRILTASHDKTEVNVILTFPCKDTKIRYVKKFKHLPAVCLKIINSWRTSTRGRDTLYVNTRWARLRKILRITSGANRLKFHVLAEEKKMALLRRFSCFSVLLSLSLARWCRLQMLYLFYIKVYFLKFLSRQWGLEFIIAYYFSFIMLILHNHH